MRLIGNKTKLLDPIEALLASRGVTGGTLIDVFCGTSSVGRHFKRRGFRVIANDMLAACHAQAVARIEVSAYPRFEGLRRRFARDVAGAECSTSLASRGAASSAARPAAAEPLEEAIDLIDSYVSPREGLIYRAFSPGGVADRRYFTESNARRIDGILEFLVESRRDGTLAHDEFHLLLASLIDAADRVANISGTYGAYLKHWQVSAERPLALPLPEVVVSEHENEAHRGDANELVRAVSGDVLYIDPPYNKRQYAANYHVLDVIAERHGVEDVDGYEASLYGKTGLRPWKDTLRSDYCVPVGTRRRAGGRDVREAMRDLVLSADVEHVVISYNEEGLLTKRDLGEILAEFSGRERFDFQSGFHTIRYKRFRSDSDRDAERVAGDGERVAGRRRYRVLEGRGRDRLDEWLFIASRARPRLARTDGTGRRRTERSDRGT